MSYRGIQFLDTVSKQNLERVFEQATPRDLEVAGAAWTRYQRIVGEVAARHGYRLVIGAAVFAALSPNSDYLGNLRDTNRLLEAARAGKSLSEFKVSTYGSNKEKAWRIVHGEDPLDLIVANKTRNFFLNVLDPSDPVPVTVDGHIFNAFQNKRLPLQSPQLKALSKRYDEVADCIRQIGSERRLLPNVVQGTLWYVWKRLNRIKHTDQLCFWADDAWVAGLGFEADW